MRYEETNHKLQKIWNLSQQQKNKIDNLGTTISVDKDKTKVLVEGYINNKFVYETDWQDMEEEKDDEGNGTGQYRTLFSISFVKIPVAFLPFIKYQVLYDTNNETLQVRNNAVFFLIKDTYEETAFEDSVVKAEMYVHFELAGEPDEQISSKIYLNIFYPDVSS